MKTVRILYGGTAIALAFAAAPASAQTAPPDRTAANERSEDIIVTAQKREQLLIDVPQSISVVGGPALEEQHANSFSEYLKLVPGLQLSQSTPGQGRLLLRGINTGGVASTVSVYVDETPFGSSSGLVNGAILAGDFDTFDVARVEVLRGPQGTLYGASSLGGVLKFVTNRPQMDSFELRGRASVEAVDGGDTSYAGNAVVNIPLGSTLAFRASGTYRRDGGFVDSIGTAGSDVEKNVNDARIYGGRASLLFAPSDAISIRATAILQDIKADAPSTVEADPFTLKPLYGRLSQSQFVPQFTDIRYRIYNGTADIDLGFANLTSSTSYATQNETLRSDVTTNLSGLVAAVFQTPNELFLAQQTNDEKFTQELRLSSDKSEWFDWLVGGYYTHEKGEILQEYVPVQPGTFTRITTLPLLAQVSLHSVYEEIAGFANATLHLGERFDIDFGGRYSHNRQHANQVGDGALAGGPTNNIASSSENVFTYSVAPKLKFDDNVSLYARVAKGFRPGGPNVLPPSAPAGTPATYNSDSVLSYEAGVKAQTPDNNFSVDFALYHIDWKDIQLLAVVNNFGVNTNGGSAKSDGAELTVTVRPTAGLNLSINGAFTNARLTADTSSLVGGLKGDRLPFTPKYSGAVNGDYRWSLGGATDAFIGGSVRLVGDQPGAFDATFRAANGRQREVPSYSAVDLRAGVDFGRFGLQAYVKNLGNSRGITSTSAVKANGFDIYPNGAIGTGIIRPRTIGLSFTAEY